MESSTTRRFGGTGLGLSISKQLITLMNGDIEVSSEEHKGSIFLFSLKLNVPEVDDIQEEVCNSRVPPTLHQDHIYPVLLVEDNEINILVALTILESYPLKVDVAKNGIQAIEMINRNYLSEDSNYCAIFMDCQMPKMDGYEASTILRQRPEFKDLPIIAMTAHAMKGDREKCLVAGMSDYITKPVEPKILEEKLSQWLSINIG
ncbi:MAG: CheY-like chemotaxis protein [Oleiphilaceae bacterium]|jgi:CheY-like chemotaxis protein